MPWTAAKLEHAIACAERAPDGLAHTKRGSFTAAQLRRLRGPAAFPLAPFSAKGFRAQSCNVAFANDMVEELLQRLGF